MQANVDRSKDWRFVPRQLAGSGITERLVKRVSRLEPQDPAQSIASVLEWAAELCPAGLRAPSIERFVVDPFMTPKAAAEKQQWLREQARAPAWRATVADQLRGLAGELRSQGLSAPIDPAPHDACRFAEHLVREHHIIERTRAAERDPKSIHGILPELERQHVQNLMLGKGWQWPVLDDTLARWEHFVATLDSQDYWEFTHFMSARDNLGAAEAICTPAVAATLRERYAAIDDRYLQLTQPLEHVIRDGTDRWSAQGWWWYRAPRNMDAGFAKTAGLPSPQTDNDVR